MNDRIGGLRSALLIPLAFCVLTGCRQQMAHQPAYRPLEPSSFFADGRSARPLIEGTVPRGDLRLGPFYTGRKPAGEIDALKAAALVAHPDLPTTAAFATVDEDYAVYLEVLPFPSAQLGAMARRGQERFDIYCSPCHDRVGTGRGMIVRRGFTPPPSFHADAKDPTADLSRGFLLRKKQVTLTKAPVGYFFEVITNGFGAMPSYRKQVPPDDRWAIVTYIRVLQFSQAARLGDVPGASEREALLLLKKEGPR
jgi:mono/diheme cytochrome c family protein